VKRPRRLRPFPVRSFWSTARWQRKPSVPRRRRAERNSERALQVNDAQIAAFLIGRERSTRSTPVQTRVRAYPMNLPKSGWPSTRPERLERQSNDPKRLLVEPTCAYSTSKTAPPLYRGYAHRTSSPRSLATIRPRFQTYKCVKSDRSACDGRMTKIFRMANAPKSRNLFYPNRPHPFMSRTTRSVHYQNRCDSSMLNITNRLSKLPRKCNFLPHVPPGIG